MRADIITELKDGDILITRGNKIFSVIIEIITRSKASHSEIYCDHKLYGSEADGFLPREFKNITYVVKRPRFEVDSVKLKSEVIKLIGKKYNFEATIIDQPIHQVFGGWFGNRSSKKLNCSQAISYIYYTVVGVYPDWYKISPDELLEDFKDFDTYFYIPTIKQ